MKKLILIAATLVMSSAAFAADAAPCPLKAGKYDLTCTKDEKKRQDKTAEALNPKPKTENAPAKQGEKSNAQK